MSPFTQGAAESLCSSSFHAATDLGILATKLGHIMLSMIFRVVQAQLPFPGLLHSIDLCRVLLIAGKKHRMQTWIYKH